MKHLLLRLLLLISLATLPAITFAQEADGGGGKSAGISKRQQEKAQAKKARREKKDVAREEKRLLKLHMKHQDKATRKRMKREKRRADNHGQGQHRDPFLRRLFTRKH